MKKQYLEIGKIVSVHGLHGEVKVLPWCDEPEFLCAFEQLYLGKIHHAVRVVSARAFKNVVILRLEGYETVEDAERLRGKILYMDREDVTLEEGVYFVQDLIGLTVVDADNGTVYGTLKGVSQTGANDVYEVHSDAEKRTYWIPAIPDVIIETDVDGGTMKIRPLEGLLDAN
jgi:16S rRNA processing protein RimM